jgi:hypothetical protein
MGTTGIKAGCAGHNGSDGVELVFWNMLLCSNYREKRSRMQSSIKFPYYPIIRQTASLISIQRRRDSW